MDNDSMLKKLTNSIGMTKTAEKYIFPADEDEQLARTALIMSGCIQLLLTGYLKTAERSVIKHELSVLAGAFDLMVEETTEKKVKDHEPATAIRSAMHEMVWHAYEQLQKGWAEAERNDKSTPPRDSYSVSMTRLARTLAVMLLPPTIENKERFQEIKRTHEPDDRLMKAMRLSMSASCAYTPNDDIRQAIAVKSRAALLQHVKDICEKNHW